jgi:hypothetical protein
MNMQILGKVHKRNDVHCCQLNLLPFFQCDVVLIIFNNRKENAWSIMFKKRRPLHLLNEAQPQNSRNAGKGEGEGVRCTIMQKMLSPPEVQMHMQIPAKCRTESYLESALSRTQSSLEFELLLTSIIRK